MAEYIDKQVALDALSAHKKVLLYIMDKCGVTEEVNKTLEIICNVPSADVVEVVRCWNCVWWDNCPSSTITPTFHRCKRVGRMGTEANDFCSFGERKDV